MEYFNTNIKLLKKRRNSKLKNNILNNISKEAFPSFLTTKHFYKRRYSKLNNISNQNIEDNKKEPKLSFSKIHTKSPENVSNNENGENRHNSLYLTGKSNLIISNGHNTPKPKKYYINKENDIENRNRKQNNSLTLSDKLKLKLILKNFETNRLTTHSLLNLEKKFPLNSVTESNYLFLFRDNINNKKKSIQKRINTNKKSKISKSSLISMKMMKEFNDRTNKILEMDKTEGTKYSNNINEFRKQIINSYKDSIILKDLNKRKINYDNAIKLLENTKEKRIKKAFELEKEFYKHKNSYENQIILSSLNSKTLLDEPKRRVSKKTTTSINKKFNEKLNEKLHLLTPNIKSEKKNTLSKYSFKNLNNLNILKTKENNHNHNNNNNNLNISNLFNKTESNKIYENNNNNLIKNKASKSLHNSNKKKLSINSIVNENKPNTNTNNKDRNNIFRTNKYLNYIYNTNNKGPNKYKSIDKSEKELLDSKEEYKKYIRNAMKERSKQFADSLASINSYFEYQPLIDMNSDMPHLNINTTNLKRVIKVNTIKKNLYSMEDDDLLTQNVKKLKDKIREVEMEYYSVDGNKRRYNLSFLKHELKRQTIAKLNHMKNPHFGVPC